MDPTENMGQTIPVLIQIGDSGAPRANVQLFTDPVCHMQVTADGAADVLAYRGRTYYFCSIRCVVKFTRQPLDFALPPDPRPVYPDPDGLGEAFDEDVEKPEGQGQKSGAPAANTGAASPDSEEEEEPLPKTIEMEIIHPQTDTETAAEAKTVEIELHGNVSDAKTVEIELKPEETPAKTVEIDLSVNEPGSKSGNKKSGKKTTKKETVAADAARDKKKTAETADADAQGAAPAQEEAAAALAQPATDEETATPASPAADNPANVAIESVDVTAESVDVTAKGDDIAEKPSSSASETKQTDLDKAPTDDPAVSTAPSEAPAHDSAHPDQAPPAAKALVVAVEPAYGMEPTNPIDESTASKYTCPMHPQILADKPGPCPLCGMALEAVLPNLKSDDDGELRDMERRFLVAMPLTVAVFLCSLPDMLGTPMSVLIPGFTPAAVNMTQLVLASPVMWMAKPFFVRAVDSIKHNSWNMFTLIGTGIGISYGYSLLATLAPSAIPADFGMTDGMPYTYFEPAAVITTLALLGQLLELKARKQTGAAIRELLTLTPPVAHFVKLDGSELDLPVAELAVKDKLRVRPGENVPTDGIVLEGRSSVDESMITGEAMLADKSTGDTVIGGTTNQAGNLTIEATRVGNETIVARIVKLVAAAQRSRPKVQQQVDKIASIFVPTVAIIAVATFIAWATFGPPPTMAFAMVSAIAVLIIACPCALGLATPMSIMVAIGRGARAGILIRDAQALEKLSEIKVLVIDKTGTLTEGRPSVTRVLTQGKWAEGQVMMLAAALEANSEHPVARAFVDYADSKDLADCKSSDFAYQPGGGVTGKADGRDLAIGSARFLREVIRTCKIDLEKTLARLEPEIQELTREGNTPVMVAVDDELVALVTMTDKVRPNAKATVEELKQLGISLRMLTGDQAATAQYVASQLGITDVMSEVNPLQKYDYIVKLQETEGANAIAMAGDGINDAPALAQAGVAIAMGSGTNIAIESADIVLTQGDLSGILRAVRLSYAMKANIRQNLILAFGYNALAVPLAAGVLYPFTGLVLNPMLASAAMAFSSVSVIANALRLRRTPL